MTGINTTEASCRGAWHGVLSEATNALDAMGGTSGSAGAAPALVVFEAAVAATILCHFRARQLLAQANQALDFALAEANGILAAQLGVRLSLVGWLAGQPPQPADLYRVADDCLDDLLARPIQPAVTFGLLLRSYVELHDFARLRTVKRDFDAAWQAASGTGDVFVAAGDELLDAGRLSPEWSERARHRMARSIGWRERDALGADAILHLLRIVAAAEQDQRPGYDIAAELCRSVGAR